MLLLLFMIWVSVKSSVSAETGAHKAQLQYGILFKDAGSIVLSTNVWKHTFEIQIPNDISPTLDLSGCGQANGDAEELCPSHGHILPLLEQFNHLSSRVNQKIIKTLEVVTRLSGPKLNIPEVNDTLPTRSRSARSLIPLIGEVGSSLFGLATEGQLKTLARHV